MQVIDTIERQLNSDQDLGFLIDLENYGKTGNDIADITFAIKNKPTDTDNSLFEKKLSRAEITQFGTNLITVTVQWPSNEYTGFVINKEYLAGLFVQWNGQATHDENVDQLFKVIVRQDFLRA